MTGRNNRQALLSLVLIACLVSEASSFLTSSPVTTQTTISQSTSISSQTEDFEQVSTSQFSPTAWLRSKKPAARCGPCPDDEDDLEKLEDVFGKDQDDNLNLNSDREMDRREAAFAMLGTLWATTTVGFPSSADALYGADAKIEMPNMMEQMANRANGQCLVESLGNRECLVWMDPENKLYQGADTQKLLQRIDTSSVALTKIPELVDAKKWMGVKSIIAGPMGELLGTMNVLAPLSTKQADQSTALAKQVKLQIFAIAAAAEKKDGNGVMKSWQGATDALVAFVQSL